MVVAGIQGYNNRRQRPGEGVVPCRKTQGWSGLLLLP